MPSCAYGCSGCGWQQDVMKKMSDTSSLTTCPECDKETFAKPCARC